VGTGFACQIGTDDKAYCWGDGALGVAQVLQSDTAIPVAGDRHFLALSVGDYHACGLTLTTEVLCWGSNAYFETADDPSSWIYTPTKVSIPERVTQLASGADHTCALTEDGAVYCWGRNVEGELGLGYQSWREPQPTRVVGDLHLVTITAGTQHTCGLDSLGMAYCWGDNGQGELGDGTNTSRSSPTPVASPHGFAQMDAGSLCTCGLTLTDAPYCWGLDMRVFGVSPSVPRLAPTLIPFDGSPFAIRSGGYLDCVLDSIGAIWCWGRGEGESITRLAGGLFQSLDVGGLLVCGIGVDGRTYCWEDAPIASMQPVSVQGLP